MDDPTPTPEPDSTSSDHVLGTTLLPTAREHATSPKVRLVLVVVALVAVAVVIAIVSWRHGTSSNSAQPQPTNAGGGAQAAPVFADSEHSLTDAAGIRAEVAALLSHRLSAAHDHLAATPSSPEPSAALSSGLLLSDPALPGCVADVEDGHALLGIDRIDYQGLPSLMIVTTGEDATSAVAWIVGTLCVQPGGDGIRTIVTTTR